MKTIIIALIIAISLTLMTIFESSLGDYEGGIFGSGMSKDNVFNFFIKSFLIYIFIVYYTMKKGIYRLKPIIIISLVPALLIGLVVLADIERHPYDSPFFVVINYMVLFWTISMLVGYVLHIVYSVVDKYIENTEENI